MGKYTLHAFYFQKGNAFAHEWPWIFFFWKDQEGKAPTVNLLKLRQKVQVQQNKERRDDSAYNHAVIARNEAWFSPVK